MQKPNKLKLTLSILLLFSAIEACVPKPPDVPVCENLSQHLGTDSVTGHQVLKPSTACQTNIGEPECGHCTYIVSGKEIYIGETTAHFLNGKSWTAIKAESVYVPAVESYGPLEDYIINSCKKMHCNKQVDAFKVKVDSLNGVKAAIQAP